MKNLVLSTTLRTSFDDAVQRTRDALSEQGFGVLTEIDVKATLRNKLGEEAAEDVGDYLILGACNPQFAHRAVGVYPQIGVLLPCNVVVRADPDAEGTVIVDAMNPRLMVEVTDEPALVEIADEVGARLQKALDGLAG